MRKRKKTGIMFVILLSLITASIYLQYGREIDVSRSYPVISQNYCEENITVVVPRLVIIDERECAEEIINKCRKNNFMSIKFSYDIEKPNALYGTVYLAPLGIKCQKLEFTFRYIQKHGEYGSYNILDNPDEFILEIDGQGIND
ncbi:MAG: hypothetical protein MSA90_06930 [Faecalicatena sp.]|uniref:hypothetical protein n=1 Tax=Faecalicatena sp. TaxID=2005360 RepID=UPI0025865F25|nr:hypothetical protein [Faecalicatena sp.]MCI6465184.1 hypothetical protein [Faecalicatena sp.]MCI7179129.1 hypothetical protein [Lachnospiraceae bacterium]MDY5620605.1 hypothetical protein [Lachnospiraceae bacterium]